MNFDRGVARCHGGPAVNVQAWQQETREVLPQIKRRAGRREPGPIGAANCCASTASSRRASD